MHYPKWQAIPDPFLQRKAVQKLDKTSFVEMGEPTKNSLLLIYDKNGNISNECEHL